MPRQLLFLLILCGIAGAHRGTHQDIAHATATLEKNPHAVETRLLRGALYRTHGQHQRSLADLDEAARQGADFATLELQRGLTLAAMGRETAAIEALTRSIEARPSWTAQVALGRSRQRLGQHVAAVLHFDAALATRPQVEVYLERGRLQRQLGRLDAAAAGYRDGLSKLGPATVVVDALVDLELRRKRVPAALALIDDRLRRGANARWLLRRAQALAVAGDRAERAATLEQALEVADRAVAKRASAINLVSRARVHLALGAVALARTDLQLALARAPGYRAAQTLASQVSVSR